jgi:DNA-binding transcriptional ArsR family regulator
MSEARTVAAVAALLGDESRAAMCLAMLDGGRWTVSELAGQASVCNATASEHVARLAERGLVSTESEGRHKYVRLAGPHVAGLVESLSSFADPEPPRSLNAARDRRRMAAARTCYDHLAGRLGVAVHDAMVEQRLLHRRNGIGVTKRGRDWFAAELGVNLDEPAGSRAFVRDCVDLTEKRPHLAGHVGAVLCTGFLAEGWVRRPDRTRALLVTPSGERALRDRLGISPADLAVG